MLKKITFYFIATSIYYKTNLRITLLVFRTMYLYISYVLSLLVSLALFLRVESGILYPRPSETREVVSLDGFWTFALSNSTRGYTEKWFLISLSQTNNIDTKIIPVPSSYNDIGADAELRDHVGPVWYQRKIFPPKSWSDKIVWIRFGSVCRKADVVSASFSKLVLQ